jgi:hypothetical protein
MCDEAEQEARVPCYTYVTRWDLVVDRLCGEVEYGVRGGPNAGGLPPHVLAVEVGRTEGTTGDLCLEPTLVTTRCGCGECYPVSCRWRACRPTITCSRAPTCKCQLPNGSHNEIYFFGNIYLSTTSISTGVEGTPMCLNLE